MANLNDPDVEAFFRQGDEGTYSGGPGDSIPAGVVNSFDDLDEDTLPRLTREQVERRDRNKRLVTGLVSALGVAAVLAVVARAVADHEGVAVAAMPVAVQRAADVEQAPPAAVAPQPAANAAEAPPTAEAPSAPPATADHAGEQSPPEALRARVSDERARTLTQQTPETPKRTARTAEKRVESSLRNSETRTVLPAPTPPMAPAGLGHSSPPTAYFPD